jgi:hypothetical protein
VIVSGIFIGINPRATIALGVSGRRRDGTTFPAEISLSALNTDQEP